MNASAAPANEGDGWQARLSLGIAHDGRQSRLRERVHEGPLYVQRPFYPEGDLCHVYILHPPGGMVGGDVIQIDISVAEGASALITTPASAKVYKSAGHTSKIHQSLIVEAEGSLEWLPQDTILFGGSRLAMETHVRLHPTSKFIGWEVTSLGRPHSGDHYESGDLRQAVWIHLSDTPTLIERQSWQAGDDVLDAPWGLGGKSALATFYAYPANRTLLAQVREAICAQEYKGFAATLLDDLLVIRALGEDAAMLRQGFSSLWPLAREEVLARSACPPRVWAT